MQAARENKRNEGPSSVNGYETFQQKTDPDSDNR